VSVFQVEEALEELALAGYVEIRDGKAYSIIDLPPR
jgi:DNA-binding FadR family transcriptional regulator